MVSSRDPQPSAGSPPDVDGCLPGLVRIAWMAGAGAALFFLALSIARRLSTAPDWALGSLDAAYWGVVVGAVALRLLDITRLGGKTADGEPATMRTWRVYALRLVLVAGGVWALAHAVLPDLVH